MLGIGTQWRDKHGKHNLVSLEISSSSRSSITIRQENNKKQEHEANQSSIFVSPGIKQTHGHTSNVSTSEKNDVGVWYIQIYYRSEYN